MYKIENGVLKKDGKKIFCVGQSYYPSFHHAKYPVPPDGDRIGEMKKDIKMMKDMGFNHIRFAAIGFIGLDDNGKLVIDTPFVDAMIEEADKNDISVSVRLQGYSVNLRNFKDVLMIDNNGDEQDLTKWFDFIQTTMSHDGLLEDNRIYSAATSAHYSKFSNVVGFQIYNEPHYPGSTFFDYHEESIKKYRIWLVQNGIMSEDDAKGYFPPKHRKEQNAEMWALWRMFSVKVHNDFLDNAAYPAKETTGLPTFTCFTTCPTSSVNARRCINVFDSARGPMDILGYTCYIHGEGYDYYPMGYALDMASCAALSQGKEAWCIELDARTYIPQNIFNKNTFAVIGSGAKAIVYYQWRGDYPSEATPIPNGCGFVNYDGSKTPNYQNGEKMVKYINSISDYIIDTKRKTDHIALFHSDYATFLCDAMENTTEEINSAHDCENHIRAVRNSYVERSVRIYTELRSKGYTVDVVDGINLKANSLDIRYLFIPNYYLLDEKDKTIIAEFEDNGGVVFELSALYGTGSLGLGYRKLNKSNPVKMYNGQETSIYTTLYTMDHVAAEYLPVPYAQSSNPFVAVQNLECEDYKVLVLTNLGNGSKVQSAQIKIDDAISSAKMIDTDGEYGLLVKDNIIYITDLKDGAVVIVK